MSASALCKGCKYSLPPRPTSKRSCSRSKSIISLKQLYSGENKAHYSVNKEPLSFADHNNLSFKPCCLGGGVNTCLFSFSCSSAWWEKHSLWPLTAPTEKKEKKNQQKKNNPRSRWHYLFSPVIPTECGTGSANSPACYPIVPLPGMAGGALFAKVDLKSRKASRSLSLSPWQAVNHLRWRAAWRRSASVDCSNCCATSLSAVLLTTCSCRTFVFFLLTSSFCLLALVAPTKYPHLSRHFQQTRSKKKKKQHRSYQLLSIRAGPITTRWRHYHIKKKQKKLTKREWERKGWREVEGRDPACN